MLQEILTPLVAKYKAIIPDQMDVVIDLREGGRREEFTIKGANQDTGLWARIDGNAQGQAATVSCEFPLKPDEWHPIVRLTYHRPINYQQNTVRWDHPLQLTEVRVGCERLLGDGTSPSQKLLQSLKITEQSTPAETALAVLAALGRPGIPAQLSEGRPLPDITGANASAPNAAPVLTEAAARPGVADQQQLRGRIVQPPS